MPSIVAVVDLTHVERSIRSVERRARFLGEAFRVIKPIMRADQREHAAQQRGPESTWPARKQSASRGPWRWRGGRGRARARVAKKPLGRLTTAVTYKVSKDGITAVSRAPWSGVHQEGGVVGHGARIPARPFLWLSDALLDRANAIITRVVMFEWGRR